MCAGFTRVDVMFEGTSERVRRGRFRSGAVLERGGSRGGHHGRAPRRRYVCRAPSPAAGANDVSKLAIRVASRTALATADEFSDGAPAKLTAELLPLSALASAFAASRNVPESPAVCIATTLPRRGGGDGANGSSFRSPSRAEDALSRKSPFLPSEEDFRFFPGDGANGSSFTSFNFDRSTHPTSFNILSDIRAACSGDRAFDMSANAARMSRTSDVRAASPSNGR